MWDEFISTTNPPSAQCFLCDWYRTAFSMTQLLERIDTHVWDAHPSYWAAGYGVELDLETL